MSYQLKVRHPLITSILTTDTYKLTMSSLAFHDFPFAKVTYTFINRSKTQFPEGFDKELINQLEMVAELALTKSEFEWMNTIRFLRPTFIEWFRGYHYNPQEVQIKQEGGALQITIAGPWYRAIHWEVLLMALISELYFTLLGVQKAPDWEERIVKKAELLVAAGAFYSDFGTRRRFSGEVQDKVVEIFKGRPGFLGTSNPHLAHKHGVTAVGTFAHELINFMSAAYSLRLANSKGTEHWSNHFGGDLGIALTDTYTTDVFLRDFDMFSAKLYDGVRHDSNDPYVWGEKMLAHYEKLGIPAKQKRLIFSDNLKLAPADQKMVGDSYNYIALHKHFQGRCQPSGGIGTFFTNDVQPTSLDGAPINPAFKPISMVIKLATVQPRRGSDFIPVVKLSDVPTKHTGTAEVIQHVKRELGIA